MIPKNALNNDEAKKELDKIKEIEKNVDREKLIYETNEYTHSFKNFQTIKTLVEIFMRVKLGLKKLINIKPIYWLRSWILRKIRNQGVQRKNKKKKLFLQTYIIFLRVERERVLDAFDSTIFLIKSKGTGILNPDHSKLKILSPKQMLQRLPIAIAQVKAGKNSESLLNEIRQIVYSLYQSKQITKNVYNNIIKSI